MHHAIALVDRFGAGGAIGPADSLYSAWGCGDPEGFTETQIAALRRLIDLSGRPIALQVDGAIAPSMQGKETARQVMEAGADTLVAGSAVFGAPDYAAVIAGLKADRLGITRAWT